MGIEQAEHNPYSAKRTLPVGNGWPLTPTEMQRVDPLRKWAQLEYGEPELLYDLCNIVGPGNYAMLGDGRGGGAGLMALGLKDNLIEGHVYTVDTYRDGFNWDSEKGHRYYQHNAERFKKWGVDSLVTQHMMTTLNAYEKFEKEKVRFKAVFIDADHSYEGVKQDLLHYMTILDSPGYVMFHDTNQDFTDKVIKELMNPNPYINLIHWVNRIKMYEVR